MILVFPGSFDPVTNGHMDIFARAAAIADYLYVVAEENTQKKYLFSREERLAMLRAACAPFANVQVDAFSGLTVDYCQKMGADAILRGLRSSADYLYERDIAAYNRDLAGVETLFLQAQGADAHISSSGVRELLRFGRDVRDYVPAGAYPYILAKYAKTVYQEV